MKSLRFGCQHPLGDEVGAVDHVMVDVVAEVRRDQGVELDLRVSELAAGALAFDADEVIPAPAQDVGQGFELLVAATRQGRIFSDPADRF